MELTWLGTAGFIVKTPQGEIAFDPFLSRGSGAASPFSIKDFANTRGIYVGHGHFDHTYDIPEIVNGTEAKVHAPGLTGKILQMRGVEKSRIHLADNKEYLDKDLKLRAFHSSHTLFDIPLILSTARRCGFRGCLHVAHLGLAYPKGAVQTYLFEVQGKKVLFASSAGLSEDELKLYRSLEVDYFLAPLQGHTHIQDIAAKQVFAINPKVVIPHHHDNFYPPMSQEISAEPVRDKLKSMGFKGDFLEIPLFEKSQL